eukprot:662248-Rhodomonas_salina.3
MKHAHLSSTAKNTVPLPRRLAHRACKILDAPPGSSCGCPSHRRLHVPALLALWAPACCASSPLDADRVEQSLGARVVHGVQELLGLLRTHLCTDPLPSQLPDVHRCAYGVWGGRGGREEETGGNRRRQEETTRGAEERWRQRRRRAARRRGEERRAEQSRRMGEERRKGGYRGGEELGIEARHVAIIRAHAPLLRRPAPTCPSVTHLSLIHISEPTRPRLI